MAPAFRSTIRFIIRHPWLALICLVVVVAAVSLVFSGGGGESPTASNGDAQQQPSPSTPGNAVDRNDNSQISLTPKPAPGDAPLSKDKRYSYVNEGAEGEGGDPEPAAQQPNIDYPESEDGTPIYAPAPEPSDVDPSSRADALGEQLETPAVQDLPMAIAGVSADLTDRAPDGRLVVSIRYRGTKRHAQAVWKRFLRQHKDSGVGYVLIYLSS